MYNNKNTRAFYTQLCIDEYNRSVNGNRDYVNESKMLMEKSREQDNFNEIRNIMSEQKASQFKKSKFSQDLYKGLIHECIGHLYDLATNKLIYSDRSKAIKESTINQFIEEEGTDNIIRHFYESSYLLSGYAKAIEDYHEKYMQEAVKNDDFDKVDKDQSFYDTIKTQDAEDVADIIRMRVNNEIDSFVQNNTEDRAKIKESLKKTQEKIDNIDPDASNSEKLEESYQIQGKREVTKIRNSRIRNIFETMVFNLCESAMKKEEVGKIYKDSNGQLNMDLIVEDCTLLYTFLETLNTAKIKDVNEEYIKETLNNLK